LRFLLPSELDRRQHPVPGVFAFRVIERRRRKIAGLFNRDIHTHVVEKNEKLKKAME
jgi:hypothetical protein